MNERIKELAEQARKKPMGNSWTYTTSTEFEFRLSRLLVIEVANLIRAYEGLTVEQGHITAKYIKKHFGVEV